MQDYKKESIELHEKFRGKLEVKSRVPITNRDELARAYTPGVAGPCLEISKDKEKAFRYTNKWNSVAIVSDGSAVLGLGNIGPYAAMPVMEGKAILFKEFGNVDAYPVCLATQETEKIIESVKLIEPGFGGINLEDISAPRCFEVEERLDRELEIPVFHDDQHGTAIVVLAGIINALKVADKRIEEVKIVVSGAGAAGMSVTKMLLNYGARNVTMLDSKGVISRKRKGLNKYKEEIAKRTNREGAEGGLKEAVAGADVFIGVSQPGVLKREFARSMAKKAIIFAMANPVPEIMPEEAAKAGALVVATGRSDYPNQINNLLAFPGVFRGALDARKKIGEREKLAAAEALAGMVAKPEREKIIPSVFDRSVAQRVAEAVKNA
ncbi:MAG: NADP-dependent malic enzyme [archaeon]